MSERTTITQVTQIGVESTPGTAVAALWRLGATSIEPSIQAEIQTFRPAGVKFNTIGVLGKEWTEASIEGAASYTDLAYLFSGVLSAATPVQQGGTSAWLWTFTPSHTLADTVRTFTVEQGSAIRAGRFAHGVVTEMGLSFSRDSVDVSGSMMGRQYQDGVRLSTNATWTLTAAGTPPTAGTFTLTFSAQTTSNIAHSATPAAVQSALEALSTIGAGNVSVVATVAAGAGNLTVANNVYTIEFIGALAQAPRTLTGTFTGLTPSGSITLAAGVTGVVPTAIALQPVLPTEVSVFLDTSGATLGNTKLTRAFTAEWNIGNRFGPLWPLDAANSSFATTIETAPEATLSLTVAADAAGMGPLTAMRAGTTRFIRIEAVGPIIAGSFPWRLTVDMCGLVSEVGEFSDEDGVYAVQWTFAAAFDATWGCALQVALQNTLTTL